MNLYVFLYIFMNFAYYNHWVHLNFCIIFRVPGAHTPLRCPSCWSVATTSTWAPSCWGMLTPAFLPTLLIWPWWSKLMPTLVSYDFTSHLLNCILTKSVLCPTTLFNNLQHFSTTSKSFKWPAILFINSDRIGSVAFSPGIVNILLDVPIIMSFVNSYG